MGARRQMGEDVVDTKMNTGLAGMTVNSTDVKCLHAHVADELTRGGNMIGQEVLRHLAAGGLNICGTSMCCDHCDVSRPLGEGRWSFSRCKNKLGRQLHKRARYQQQLKQDHRRYIVD